MTRYLSHSKARRSREGRRMMRRCRGARNRQLRCQPGQDPLSWFKSPSVQGWNPSRIARIGIQIETGESGRKHVHISSLTSPAARGSDGREPRDRSQVMSGSAAFVASVQEYARYRKAQCVGQAMLAIRGNAASDSRWLCQIEPDTKRAADLRGGVRNSRGFEQTICPPVVPVLLVLPVPAASLSRSLASCKP